MSVALTRRLAPFVFVLVFLASAGLSLASLSQTAFWDDEAQVAIIARNCLTTGHLTGWDGRNLYGYRNGTLLDQNLDYINPPLDCLVVAASFRAFGPSTWAGRLPFVLAGWGSLGLFLLLLRRDFPGKSLLHGYAFGLFALSTLFLLNIRTCRYYALSLLLSLGMYWFYRRALAERRAADFLLLAGTAVLAFYASFLLGAAFVLALCAVHLAFHRRDFTRGDWAKAALAVVVFALLTLPYALAHRIWVRQDIVDHEPWIRHRLILLWWNFRDLGLINSFPWVAGIGVAAFLARHHPQDPEARPVWEWTTLAGGYVVFLALFSPQSTPDSAIADVRYLTPATPFLAGLLGLLLWQVHRRFPLVAAVLFLVLVCSNTLSLSPWYPTFRWLLPAYIAEVSHPYPTANGAAVEFLRRNARQDDTVYADPEYLDYPLLFYMGSKIRLCGQIDHLSPLPMGRLRRLGAPLLLEENFPDWVICFGAQPDTGVFLHYFGRSYRQGGRMVHQTYRLVRTLDVFWSETQRPELPWHSFGPKHDFDRAAESVHIFRRDSQEGAARAVAIGGH